MPMMSGVLWIGAVVVLVLGIAVGYAMRGDENRAYHASRQRALADNELAPAAAIPAIAERVLPQPPPPAAHITQHFHLTPGVTPWDLDAIQHPQRVEPLVIDAPHEAKRA